MHAHDRPVPAEPIDLAPVTPKLLAEYGDPPISLEEAEENLGRGLGVALTISVGFWGGVIVALSLLWS
jgi:hypothetical protein